MPDPQAEFDDAVAAVDALPTDPGNDVKLRLYALYKQASIGDVEGRRPGLTNPVGRAKYDSWASVTGMSAEEAKSSYVRLAAHLRGASDGPGAGRP